jgi:hypothetical protein
MRTLGIVDDGVGAAGLGGLSFRHRLSISYIHKAEVTWWHELKPKDRLSLSERRLFSAASAGISYHAWCAGRVTETHLKTRRVGREA